MLLPPLSAPPFRFHSSDTGSRRSPQGRVGHSTALIRRRRDVSSISFVIFLFILFFFVLNTGVGGVGDSGRTRARRALERGISRPLRSHVDPYMRRKSSEAVAGEMTTSRERGEIRSYFVPFWVYPIFLPRFSSRMEEAPNRRLR